MRQKPSTKEDHVRSSFREETATRFFFPQKLPVKRDNKMQRYSWLEKLSKGSSLQKFSGINYVRNLPVKRGGKPYGIIDLERPNFVQPTITSTTHSNTISRL